MRLEPIDPAGADRRALVAFLTGNAFPFHLNGRPTAEEIERRIDEGAYRNEAQRSFWLVDGEEGRVGFVRLEDLGDPVPLFDLRLGEAYRGRGFGTRALRAVTSHVFGTMPAVNRFEGQTREDNVGMRRVFLRCGWLMEGYYREAWPVEAGAPLASIAYGILRRDWERGETTPIDWAAVTP